MTTQKSNTLDERDTWADLAANGLAGAYGDNEPEYTEDDLLEGRDLLQAQRPVMNHVWDNRIDDETWSSPNEPE